MAPVAFSPEEAGNEAAILVAMAEETKDAYKREKASLIGFQRSFTKKETMWREAVELWHKDPRSNASREVAVEFRQAAREEKARLDTALYSVISYGVVTDAFEKFMEQVEDRYQIINEVFMKLSTAYEEHLKKEEDQKLQLVRDERAEVKRERDERRQELEARDLLEANRVDRKARLMDLELLVIRERAAQEAAVRANPAPAPLPPVPLAPAPPAAWCCVLLLPCNDATGKFHLFILVFFAFSSHRKNYGVSKILSGTGIKFPALTHST